MNPDEIKRYTQQMRTAPERLEALVRDLTPEELTTAYLPGEWTVAQNIHHLADAQMALFFRFKVILLEDHPTVKPFDQDDWTQTIDSTDPALIDESLGIVRGVHLRWARLAESLADDDWSRTGYHPETGILSLKSLFPYACGHGDAHVAQISQTLDAR